VRGHKGQTTTTKCKKPLQAASIHTRTGDGCNAGARNGKLQKAIARPDEKKLLVVRKTSSLRRHVHRPDMGNRESPHILRFYLRAPSVHTPQERHKILRGGGDDVLLQTRTALCKGAQRRRFREAWKLTPHILHSHYVMFDCFRANTRTSRRTFSPVIWWLPHVLSFFGRALPCAPHHTPHCPRCLPIKVLSSPTRRPQPFTKYTVSNLCYSKVVHMKRHQVPNSLAR